MGVFGKRATAVAHSGETYGFPAHKGPDADGVSRIIPKETWDGPQGKTLSELGFSPDDARNLTLTPQLAQARADAAWERQQRFISQVIEQMPKGVTLSAYAMLPWSVWDGPHGAFLMGTCEFYPTQPWNTMLLPSDAYSAAILGLPEHPRRYPPGLEEAALDAVAKAHDELMEAHKQTSIGLARNDTSALSIYSDAIDTKKHRIIAYALTCTSITFGEDVSHKHLQMFGKTLGWPHAEGLLKQSGLA